MGTTIGVQEDSDWVLARSANLGIVIRVREADKKSAGTRVNVDGRVFTRDTEIKRMATWLVTKTVNLAPLPTRTLRVRRLQIRGISRHAVCGMQHAAALTNRSSPRVQYSSIHPVTEPI